MIQSLSVSLTVTRW